MTLDQIRLFITLFIHHLSLKGLLTAEKLFAKLFLTTFVFRFFFQTQKMINLNWTPFTVQVFSMPFVSLTLASIELCVHVCVFYFLILLPR